MEFKKMDEIQKRILMEVADLHTVPEGAFNIRSDGQLAGRANSANIEITSKENGKGIDIRIKDGTKNESVHIPVILSKSGLHDVVYNDFYVGENCDVIIVAGCGISNCGGMDSEHDGIHRFFVRSTTERATAPARGSSIRSPKSTCRKAVMSRWRWSRSRASTPLTERPLPK